MKLTFLGTRGGIIARSAQHYYHSSLLIRYHSHAILIDWGQDWLGKQPPPVEGLLITHAHPDHAQGLKKGFPAPVYMTAITAELLKQYPLDTVIITPQKPFHIGLFGIIPFAVHHSIRAPAVGYRVTAGEKSLFYVSDLVSIIHPKKALTGIDLYIGDGAIITRTLLKRTKNGIPTGHCSMSEQLSWCQHYKVPQAIFTHCGSEIVKGRAKKIQEKVKLIEQKSGIKTRLAYDGMVVEL